MKSVRPAGLFLLLFVCLCFSALPVMGENPWDADANGNNGKSKDTDTTDILNAESSPTTSNSVGDDGPSVYQDFIYKVSYRITSWFFGDYYSGSAQTVETKEAETTNRKALRRYRNVNR